MINTAKNYGGILALVAVLCTFISTLVYFMTHDTIMQSVRLHQQQLLQEVLPQSYYDNDLLQSCSRPVSGKYSFIKQVYMATLKQERVAYVVESIAPDGYSGNIALLTAFTPKGEILGVRVLEHNETPGLGDKIELRISDWILSFNHQWVTSDTLTQWAVKKEGGRFDQFAGATITPRAVINMVKKTVLTLNEKPIDWLAPCVVQ